ncbi:MAG: hypothetical protein WCY91_10535 [Acidithiobacillus sp.]|jgi:hypothetical protein|uniref:hypothetical protein n=1 Tax=Acidithiobacillus TaxID=119977 RepID=UPI001C06B934|nr:hypothetical protein [Acidithiobacillus ferridurans]MBU2731624.1 hypothetical protein [Acidithiobacillus ferridurans]
MSTDFDQNTAWIRRAQTDMKAFVEGLASRLEGDMPGFVEVERKRDGLFAKTSHIEAITIHTDNNDYFLKQNGVHVSTVRAKTVRGVVLKHEDLPLSVWLESLVADLADLSGAMRGASNTLHDFLMG